MVEFGVKPHGYNQKFPSVNDSDNKQAKANSGAGQKFEAYFLEKLLESGNKSITSKDGYLGDGAGSDILMQMQNKAFANELSKSGGFGIAKMINDLESL